MNDFDITEPPQLWTETTTGWTPIKQLERNAELVPVLTYWVIGRVEIFGKNCKIRGKKSCEKKPC